MKKVHFAPDYFINPRHPITVNVIGCGGTGSHVLTCLARINHALLELGHVGLEVKAWDDDVVTESNVGRQAFSMADIGLKKANVLITRINRYYGFEWVAMNRRYTTKVENANMTISCVDTVKSRKVVESSFPKMVNRNGNECLVPYYWMDFGNSRHTGQVVMGTVGNIDQPTKRSIDKKRVIGVKNMPTFFDMFNEKDIVEDTDGPSCSMAEALNKQDLFINSSLAQLGCGLIWRLLHDGVIMNRGFFLNLNTMLMVPMTIE